MSGQTLTLLFQFSRVGRVLQCISWAVIREIHHGVLIERVVEPIGMPLRLFVWEFGKVPHILGWASLSWKLLLNPIWVLPGGKRDHLLQMNLKPFSTSSGRLNKFWSMSGTNKTSKIYFILDKLSIATVPFPLTEIKSPFSFFTLETKVLSSSLKSLWSLVIWFLQPLSINHESHELLLVAKHVATKSWPYSCWSMDKFV